MSILRKIRTLVAALVRQPFAARPEKVALDEGEKPSGPRPAAAEPQEKVEDAERVADLISSQRRREGGG